MISDFLRVRRITQPPLSSLVVEVFPSMVVMVSPLSFSMMPI
jgi:hypothetical protein